MPLREENPQKHQMRKHKSSIILRRFLINGSDGRGTQHDIRNICKERKTVKIKRVKIIVIIKWKDQHDQQLWSVTVEAGRCAGHIRIFAYSYRQSPAQQHRRSLATTQCRLLCSSGKTLIVVANFDVCALFSCAGSVPHFIHSFVEYENDMKTLDYFFSLFLCLLFSLLLFNSSSVRCKRQFFFSLYPFLPYSLIAVCGTAAASRRIFIFNILRRYGVAVYDIL